MTATPHVGIVSAVQHLQDQRDQLLELLRRIEEEVGYSLPADLRAELQRHI